MKRLLFFAGDGVQKLLLRMVIVGVWEDFA